MTSVVLTVQSAGKPRWRLGLTTSDSRSFFSHLELVQIILSPALIVKSKAACGSGRKKAFDFNGKQLSNWIIQNGFKDYAPGYPTKLRFNLSIQSGQKVLKYVPKLGRMKS